MQSSSSAGAWRGRSTPVWVAEVVRSGCLRSFGTGRSGVPVWRCPVRPRDSVILGEALPDSVPFVHGLFG
ncbi:hypothetical protein EBN03_23320 [Nocardia stercoris]|uniref:Uncharacterized protein n=1 Tax=Nocardia stercoris TaxID=2483361 RepID=A0A3M2KYI7_9NOCA|nr:hypothetical protein EBN03_23320 [Nocardia stercoris]